MANNKIKFELNYSGVGQLLKSDIMRQCVESYARDIARRCGTGYSYDTKMMGTRVIASAFADTEEAKQDNYDNNTLLRNAR